MNTSVTNTDEYIAKLPTWQQTNLQSFRSLVRAAVPEVREEIKWGVPTFFDGKKMLFAMAAFKAHTKYNFIYNGALLSDPDKLFNNGLESAKARAIDVKEGKSVDTAALNTLIEQSVRL